MHSTHQCQTLIQQKLDIGEHGVGHETLRVEGNWISRKAQSPGMRLEYGTFI